MADPTLVTDWQSMLGMISSPTQGDAYGGYQWAALMLQAAIAAAQQAFDYAKLQGETDANARQIALQEAQLVYQQALATGYIGGQPTLEREVADRQYTLEQAQLELQRTQQALQQAQLMGYVGQIPTLERQYQEAQINLQQAQFALQQGMATGVVNGVPTLDYQRLMLEQQLAGGYINGQPTLARQQMEAQYGLGYANLLGSLKGPNDWVTYWNTMRGAQNSNLPQWAGSLMANQGMPAFQGPSGGYQGPANSATPLPGLSGGGGYGGNMGYQNPSVAPRSSTGGLPVGPSYPQNPGGFPAPMPSNQQWTYTGKTRTAPPDMVFSQEMVYLPTGQFVSKQQAYELGWDLMPAQGASPATTPGFGLLPGEMTQLPGFGTPTQPALPYPGYQGPAQWDTTDPYDPRNWSGYDPQRLIDERRGVATPPTQPAPGRGYIPPIMPGIGIPSSGDEGVVRISGASPSGEMVQSQAAGGAVGIWPNEQPANYIPQPVQQTTPSMPLPPWASQPTYGAPQSGGGSVGSLPGWSEAIGSIKPYQITPQQWNRMMPSEQEGLLGAVESFGGWGPDFLAMMQRAWPQGNAAQRTFWR